MQKVHLIFIFIFILISIFNLTYIQKSSAKTTFKGGVITQSKSLHTKKPKQRTDLIYDLKSFDDSHLDVIITKNEAIRLERRIGIGVPIDRVKLHIGKTRREAINDIISDLNKYVNNTELNIDFEFLSKDILNSNLSGCPSEPELPLINTYEKLFNEKRNIWHSSLEQVLNLLYQKKILQNLKKFYLTR